MKDEGRRMKDEWSKPSSFILHPSSLDEHWLGGFLAAAGGLEEAGNEAAQGRLEALFDPVGIGGAETAAGTHAGNATDAGQSVFVLAFDGVKAFQAEPHQEVAVFGQ